MFEKKIVAERGNFTLHAIKTDKFKMSRLSFNFILPADREKSPLTKLMLAVMMRGSEKYRSVVEINRRLDEFYGATVTWRTNSVGGRHVFRISCEMLNNRYRFDGDNIDIASGVASIILEILLNPLKNENGLLCESNIASEKKIAIDALRAKINDQKAYSADQCRKYMLGDDISGISSEGSIEQIENFSAEELTENINYFLENSVLECYYVGEEEPEDIARLISDAFVKVNRRKCEIPLTEKAFLPENTEEKEIDEIMDVSQGRLNVGCICRTIMSDEDYYAMNLFNEIFGGSSTAKLFMNVREKQSLCYYCYSSFHSANGTLMINCGIKKENKERALAEIRNQLSAMQKGDFSDGEIATAKKTIISGMRQINDSPSALEAFSFRRLLAGVGDQLDYAIAQVENVSREEIMEAAKKVSINTVYFLCGERDDYLEEECADE